MVPAIENWLQLGFHVRRSRLCSKLTPKDAMLRDPIMHDAGLSSGIHRRLSSVRLCYELNFTETPELESLTRSPVEEPGEKQREL